MYVQAATMALPGGRDNTQHGPHCMQAPAAAFIQSVETAAHKMERSVEKAATKLRHQLEKAVDAADSKLSGAQQAEGGVPACTLPHSGAAFGVCCCSCRCCSDFAMMLPH
jgi:hypothetical protein